MKTEKWDVTCATCGKKCAVKVETEETDANGVPTRVKVIAVCPKCGPTSPKIN